MTPAFRDGPEKTAPELVLTGGKVWTGGARDPGEPPVGSRKPAIGEREPTAVAIAGGRILAVGEDDEIRALAGPDTERIALAGRRLVPGFLDSHTHFLEGGRECTGADLRDAESREAFVRRVAEHARTLPDGAWLTGGNWNHEFWGGELPRADWIDAVTSGRPAFLHRHDRHVALANSLALRLAGIGATTPNPPGGRIERNPDGSPTGILRDTALELVRKAIPPPTAEELDQALDAASGLAARHGLTCVTDMGTAHPWMGLETYRRARREGRLTLRVYAAVPIRDRSRLAAFVREQGRGDDWLRWGAVKAFVDGSLGAGTAWFHEPLDDDPGNRGLLVTDPEELRTALCEADAAGLQLLVHAIGDRANDWLLDAFEEIRRRNGPRDRRSRIEHAQHLRPAAIPRFRLGRVIASMQPYHLVDDGCWAERRIGRRRARTTYAFRSLIDAGASLAFGSDWTVAPLDPLAGLHAAVTRRTRNGAHPDGWIPEQRIDLTEALTAYTAGAAYAAFLEEECGTVVPGKNADLVVLSEDLLKDPDADLLREARVELTLVGGRVVYRADTFA